MLLVKKEYGFFEEKLRTPEEKEEEAKGFYAYHMMREVPKYKDISEAFFEEERKRDKYQVDCKNEFFKLFTKHFYDLWD